MGGASCEFVSISFSVLREEFAFLKECTTFWSPSYFVCSSGNVSSETSRKYIEECQEI
ncbi:MAG: transposase [Candidatus Hermodarchaeota archaeon]